MPFEEIFYNLKWKQSFAYNVFALCLFCGLMMKRVVIISHYNNNQQQQKAQTLSGWSNFVGKQTLFDQLNKLKKNMYSANNGRQHQSNKFHTYNKNSSNDNYQEYQDNQVSGYIIRSKDLKSEKDSANCAESNDLENRTRVEINSLPHMGTSKVLDVIRVIRISII